MIDFELSEEQLAIQSVARRFAEREIRPIAEGLDRSVHPVGDFPWTLVNKGSEIGLRTIALPPEYDGPGFDLRTWVVVLDELGYPDAACASIFSENWKRCRAIVSRGTREQKDRFLPAFRDDHSFLLGGSAAAPERLSAVRAGDHYVLHGTTSFAALGPLAKLLVINAHLGTGIGVLATTGTFLIPSDTPGVRLGRVHDKVGTRMHVHADVHFDQVEVPADNLLGGKEAGPGEEDSQALEAIELSARAMALSRAALDAATKYATERVQGGSRIIEHQAVALALADMYISLQAGRSLLWRNAWMADHGQMDRALATACGTFCARAAVDICHDAVELFGGPGVMRELPMQKYFRDALTLLHARGINNNHSELGAMLDVRAREQRL